MPNFTMTDPTTLRWKYFITTVAKGRYTLMHRPYHGQVAIAIARPLIVAPTVLIS